MIVAPNIVMTPIVTTKVGALTSSVEPRAAPITINKVIISAARKGKVLRYAIIFMTLLLASNRAASATPSFVPKNNARVGTSSKDPPRPAEAEMVKDT